MGLADKLSAHPHVFVEASVEIVRNDEGHATHIRHVWRFDALFSTMVLIDFDENGDNKLDEGERSTIAEETKGNLAQFNFYTEIRAGGKIVNFFEPDPFLVDFEGGQMLMILSLELEKPQPMQGETFKIAVSDPTYYVAMELVDEKVIHLSGLETGCNWSIARPDFDKLLAENPEIANDDYGGTAESGLEADAFLTWVNFKCS